MTWPGDDVAASHLRVPICALDSSPTVVPYLRSSPAPRGAGARAADEEDCFHQAPHAEESKCALGNRVLPVARVNRNAAR